MSAPDRSWTVGWTLFWFAWFFLISLRVFTGGLDAVADRLTQRREIEGPIKGPAFAPPIMVAEAADEDDKAGVPAVGSDSADRANGTALEDTCIDGATEACKRWAMDAFYKSVGAEKANTLGRAVRVSWYGDSVVATDAIPARLRSRLQTELGDGGPGFIYVIQPHRFCHHEGITRSHTGSWAAHSISTLPSTDGLYGAGGSSAETGGGGATIKLVAGKASRVELYYLGQPNGGTAIVTADGTEVVRADTKADAKQAGGAGATIEKGAGRFAIETKGKVRLFGIGLENADGAVVDNLGIVSVNVKNFAQRNEENFANELQHRGSDLIMIMIGANEAQWLGPNDSATKQYGGHYEKVLNQVRKARPEASCLVVSPTDQAEAKDGGYPSRPVMPVLVDQQRKAAQASGCAFFSTYDWMGGKGSASTWYRRGMVSTDFQHLSRKGANKMADAVYDALMAGYQRYASH